ncbi:MAG: Gfo/Idh/MocA family oxidoreductase [Verrucomicrobiota bacterium]|jgi:predicted dehydrogenase|nr:Gfo/Idh/MocA family oxidoreductase [Verrucomicrobiota bacterium]MEC8656214.1 Gfo/Idh/MocA family oxidoreductase [Verrucomicrobiota bacterium]MEC8791879.1 Gfo/Idh/MocA family oxidoreductase [Verrucomicrobiota bacterium]MEC8865888.1 Gfo/Idh/MocA family oxidoreductase [Verrucomicrobiota bacterium]MED5280774.1 Gfo/Idh/MocA family oxidoreductase [Verrucomicrobiota bacterium]|tara:strand:+ start:2235 stop:3401 length:1167 start_codon:yes stop_codon:yes gene_type:complete
MKRKLRMGMVGGGRGAFIGGVHRRAAALDGEIELVAGAFSSDPRKSALSGKDFYLKPSRVYGSYQEMAEKEKALPENERIDFVTIVVQNFLHFEVAKTFLEAGFNVICDKPVTLDLEQARELRKIIKKSKKVFALTHNYTGYPMVKLARQMIRKGDLGKLIKVVCEYPQGYAITALTGEDKAIANWRANPKIAGISNCMGDIGTHAENLVHYVTGLEIDRLCADLSVNIPGRTLDDDGNVLVRFKGGARGIIYASQVSNGDENDLTIRVYGTKKSLEWHQEEPNDLIVKDARSPRQVYRRGNDYVTGAAAENTRIPFGHPEGFIEAFANVYNAAALAIRDERAGKFPRKSGYDYPDIRDGIIGMAFIETVVKSSKSKEKWIKFPSIPK